MPVVTVAGLEFGFWGLWWAGILDSSLRSE